MTDKKPNNPLYGLKLELLLTEISDHYGWELLSLMTNNYLFPPVTAIFLMSKKWANLSKSLQNR